jgi:uncharacterized membrane protein
VSPERFRLLVSIVLTVGVGISAALIGAGFAAALAVGWQGSLIGASTSAAASAATTDFGDLPSRLAILEPLAIAQLGLLTLLATPVARVATSVVAFASEGDRLYAAITLAVLAILLASILFLH